MSSTVTSAPKANSLDIRTVLAFAAIYILWGSTFLAVRITVLLIPPWFAAGTRFFTAGVILFAFCRLRGVPIPTAAEWRSLAIVGFFMFSLTYGALFWGEQFVPSGITAVLEATLPLITVLLETLVFRQKQFHWRALIAILVGFCGVGVIFLKGGHQPLPAFPCFVILLAGTSWSLGAVWSRGLPLPSSRPLTAGAEMMLGGALLLILSALTGELHPFPAIPTKAAVALVYLIVAGSLIAFTAFVWLLGRMPASKVASHAYVNPVVAIALGYFVASEEITLRTLIGSALVIGSVFLTLRDE